MKFSGPD